MVTGASRPTWPARLTRSRCCIRSLLAAESTLTATESTAPRSARSCRRSPRRSPRRASRPSAPTPLIIDARSPLPITLDVEEPLTVGADRIINTLAASRIYRRDTIVVDLGTATTYDCITADGVFLGGVIAPGIRTSAETLSAGRRKLPATEIAPPARVIGRRTEECIRSGVVLGGAEAIDGLVRRIKDEWPGGVSPAGGRDRRPGGRFEPFCREFEIIEPYLTLIGLRIAHELVSARS